VCVLGRAKYVYRIYCIYTVSKMGTYFYSLSLSFSLFIDFSHGIQFNKARKQSERDDLHRPEELELGTQRTTRAALSFDTIDRPLRIDNFTLNHQSSQPI